MRTLLILLLTCSCLCVSTQAQIDSVIWPLPMAKVLEERPPAMHYDLLKNDSSQTSLLPLYFSTSDLMQFSSAAYLRDYGNQTLSTISIRGSSSQQTEVLWNGARISNPMLGLGDISMLPLMFFSDIHLQSLQKNGVYNPIGGAISLKSGWQDSSFYTIGIGGGQFGHIKGIARAQYNVGEKLKAKLQLSSIQEDQDFPYQEEHTSVLLPSRQPHAKILQQGIMGQISYKVHDHHTVSSSLWLQGSEREIPPLISQSKSEAVQKDSFYRAQFEWESEWNRYRQWLRFTKRDETNIYSDPLNGIQNQNEFSSIQIQNDHQYSAFRYWIFSYGFSYEHIQAKTGNYLRPHSTDTWLAYVNPVYSIPGTPFQLDLAVRYSQQNSTIAPPGGHAAIKWSLANQFVSFSYQQANRFPAMNDLYWRPGGNPSLQPEFSQQLNLAYGMDKHWGDAVLTHQFNGFYKKVDNWILWAPTEQFIWKPENLIEVTASGFDYSLQFLYSINKQQQLQFDGNFLYQYVRNTGKFSTPLAQQDGNLIYMPSTKANGSITYQIGGFEISYLHHFRSSIYTRPNLSESLEPLHTGQARITYQFTMLGQDIKTFLQGYNIWDQSYFFQPNRPAPGRHWRFGLLIQNH